MPVDCPQAEKFGQSWMIKSGDALRKCESANRAGRQKTSDDNRARLGVKAKDLLK